MATNTNDLRMIPPCLSLPNPTSRADGSPGKYINTKQFHGDSS